MRINIYGVPASGKTTLASELFAELKKRGHRVEHITEQAKPWALRGSPIVGWTQLEVFTKQIRSEERAITHIPHLVTDCPLWLMVAYAIYHDCLISEQLIAFARRFDEEHESISIKLPIREQYDAVGRLHSQEELPGIDYLIDHVLRTYTQSPLIHAGAKSVAELADWFEDHN